MTTSLGKKISELRKQRGITQDQLAEEMGVSSQAVSKWENDISCPDIMMLPQLAEYFNVSIDELLRGEKAHEARMVTEVERKDVNKMMVRVLVHDGEGNNVKVNLPVPLIKMGLEIGMQMPDFSGSAALKNIDFEAIMKAIDCGVMGKIVEVEGADGEKVDIFVE
ncbi:helix-turn-helix transcriptional regulator [Paludicola sp. MB14-C6]|uniref:helix-turn-helix domain-containing protein n=1 Tax=Paludihabitans sp. MB14-C6 TaxID=3070656 RepID=UPI0027DB49C0|nr:helix-turn-helix transcriptional regulator [Paludicola sp. MB14-C6]WMJ22815.1 helix-turn-helix transcriptional regulator [Paludicola sp. MB14-C6]